MTWLANVNAVVFYGALVMVALLAAMFLFVALRTGQIAGAAGQRQAVPVNALSEGVQLMRGRATGPLLKAPLSGRPCVWWEVWVWERVQRPLHEREGPGDNVHWAERRHEHSSRPIQCVQGTVTCAVLPDGITHMVPTEVRDWTGQHDPPQEPAPAARPGSAFSVDLTPARLPAAVVLGKLQGVRYRYLEQIITPGSQLHVLGQVERIDPQEWSDEEPPVDPQLLKAWQDSAGPPDKARNAAPQAPEPPGGAPDTVAQDKQWAADIVAQQEQRAADMRAAQWQIHRPRGEPYIVSTQPPAEWIGEQRQASTGGWIMGALFAALAAFMLWARLGAA